MARSYKLAWAPDLHAFALDGETLPQLLDRESNVELEETRALRLVSPHPPQVLCSPIPDHDAKARIDDGDVPVAISLAATLGFLLLCLGVVAWIFRTGYRLRA